MAVANRLNLAQTDMLSLGNNSCFVEPLFLLAAMSFSDSEAVFFQRCREIGFEDEAIDNMKNQQLTTMSRFAFACNYSPAGTDEAPLVNLAKEVYGKDPSTVEMAFIRRIFNEAYVNVASDIKSKAESTDETPIRKLAPAERSERLKQQQQRLRGINISGPLEPGDSLIDKCISIYESDRIQYVSWESAVSREHELLTGLKRDTQLTFDGSGTLKLQKANQVEPCNTSSEIQVKYALTRRALAFEQANLVKFSLMEAWSEKMMQCRLEEPSSGFARTTMKQLEQADRKLFVVLGEHTREGIKANTAGRPIDLIFEKCMQSSEVMALLQPRPIAANKPDREAPKPVGESPVKRQRFEKGGKGTFKGKGKSKGSNNARIPHELLALGDVAASTPKGMRLCFGYNLKRCPHVVDKQKCERGLHCCCIKGCFKSHPALDHGKE